jgi:hypothetical protein
MGPAGPQGIQGVPGESGGASNLTSLGGVTTTGKYLPLDSVSRRYSTDWSHIQYTSRMDVPAFGNVATIYEITELGKTVSYIWISNLEVTQDSIDGGTWNPAIAGGNYVPIYLTSTPNSGYYWDGAITNSGVPIINFITPSMSALFEAGALRLSIARLTLGNSLLGMSSIKGVTCDSLTLPGFTVAFNSVAFLAIGLDNTENPEISLEGYITPGISSLIAEQDYVGINNLVIKYAATE